MTAGRDNILPGASAGRGNGSDESLRWHELRTEHLIRNEWIDLRESWYTMPDGSVRGPFYTYTRKDFCVIAATDEAGRYICVRQYRQGIGKVTTEFPAGGIESGDDGDREGRPDLRSGEEAVARALRAAMRELREETGYESEEWRHLLTVPANATIADNYVHLFAAENCRLRFAQHLDETEVIRVKLYTADEIDRMIAEGKFQQAIHILAWELAGKQRNHLR